MKIEVSTERTHEWSPEPMMGEPVEEPTKHPAVVDLAVLEIQHFQQRDRSMGPLPPVHHLPLHSDEAPRVL